MAQITGSLILGGITLSKIINWIVSQHHTYEYVISGASWYEDNLELWTSTDSLSEFLDTFDEAWENHFGSDGTLPYHGETQYVWFAHKGLDEYISEADWSKEGWEGSQNKVILDKMHSTLEEYWSAQWECGYGHATSEGHYEVRWCKTNGS